VRRARTSGRLSNFAAGLLSLVLIVSACWVIFGGPVPFRGGWELKAVVTGAHEVHTRTPVRIAGVEVGKVKTVERHKGGTALITMELRDHALPLHEDATLKVRPRIFLEGNFFLDIQPGTPSAPTVEEGHTIPISHTAVPVQLDEILASLKRPVRDDLQSLVHAWAVAVDERGGGGRALRRTLPELAPAFRSLAQVSEAARGERAGDLPGWIRHGGRTAAALARNEGRLAELVTGLNRTVRALASRSEQLEASLPELDGLLAEAVPAFEALDRAFPPTRALAREIRPGLRAAPATLRLANPVLAQAQGLLRPGELPAALGQLEPSVRSLARLEPKLTELLGVLEPVTECVRRNALPTLTSVVDDPPHTTGAPVYRELLSGLVGLSSGSQNFDGNGQAVRYHAGFGDETVTTGRAPSAGESLVGLTSEPILGSRPRYTADPPPFRPDVPCASQQPPDLRADTGPAPEQSAAPPASPLPDLPLPLLPRVGPEGRP
jgi:phospholipid/cholesterol/gamma-HCH transport system substrate-binding protein